jgi:hypothetical protein
MVVLQLLLPMVVDLAVMVDLEQSIKSISLEMERDEKK